MLAYHTTALFWRANLLWALSQGSCTMFCLFDQSLWRAKTFNLHNYYYTHTHLCNWLIIHNLLPVVQYLWQYYLQKVTWLLCVQFLLAVVYTQLLTYASRVFLQSAYPLHPTHAVCMPLPPSSLSPHRCRWTISNDLTWARGTRWAIFGP